jgi:hypothetical protein
MKITANFSKITHNLTLQVSGNGAITPVQGNHDYVEGTVVNITAKPDSGWRFDRWVGEVSDPNAVSTTVTINSDKTITAKFSNILHTLTIKIDGSGSTIPEAGTHSYSIGTVVNVQAIPDSGWQFDGWNGSAANPSLATNTLTMDSDKLVTAIFSQDKPSWWLISGGIIAGIIIISVMVWWAVRLRKA